MSFVIKSDGVQIVLNGTYLFYDKFSCFFRTAHIPKSVHLIFIEYISDAIGIPVHIVCHLSLELIHAFPHVNQSFWPITLETLIPIFCTPELSLSVHIQSFLYASLQIGYSLQ